MSKSKYFQIGYDTGYDIAKENISELTKDNQEKFLADMSEHESDVYRQYSPFEFLAKEINDYESRWNREGELWECYDRGVTAGIQKAIDERLQELKQEKQEESDEELLDNPFCPACDGIGIPLGNLGNTHYFRCESCGMTFSAPDSASDE